MPRFGPRKPKLDNETFIKMRMEGGRGQMNDLIVNENESNADDDYFDPNAGQDQATASSNIKPWDGRGGKMPSFARGTPVSISSLPRF